MSVSPPLELASQNRSFAGWQCVYRHDSQVLQCEMKFGLYLPPQAEHQPCPVLFWLSGLTCTEQNFITKAGAQQYAALYGFIVVAPDTSPRGCQIPGEEDSYDLGTGAGFYVNATQDPWARHYRMYDYVVSELPALISQHFQTEPHQWGIFGHSMGGLGALMIGLKNPSLFQSISAFAPITAPSQVPWGQKAFHAYLGADPQAWAAYDPVQLVSQASQASEILVDQGDADEFLPQLHPELLMAACAQANYPLKLRRHPGYDHSYYFIASFIGDHFAHHARCLRLGQDQ